MTDKKQRPWFCVYLVITVLLVAWIGVRTQMTADRQEREAQTAVQFSDHTRDCLSQLVNILRERAAITDAADRANNEQHRVIREMVAAVAAAELTDKEAVLNAFLPQVTKAQQEQEDLLAGRAQHPLPDPSCPR